MGRHGEAYQATIRSGSGAFSQTPNSHKAYLLATIFTWLVTALGAVPVFFAQGVSRKLLDLMLDFAIMMILDVALG
jgi:zinc transporter ZupT